MDWKTQTTEDFEKLSWHDAMLHGMGFNVDNDDEPWRNEIIFDVDLLQEWLLQEDGTYRFAVCPASLCFHDVTDLHVDLSRSVLCGVWIMGLTREPIEEAAAKPPRYRWTLELDGDDEIRFASTGFTQSLLSEPVIRERQHLSHEERERLVGVCRGRRCR